MPLRPRILALGPLALVACVPGITIDEELPGAEQFVGETRTVTLHYREFPVKDYRQELTCDDLKTKIPRKILDDLWLLDFELTDQVTQVVQQVRDFPPSELDKLSTAARNAHKLINMTPDNANLEGTKLEEAIALSGAVGIPPAKVLAALLDIGVTDYMLPNDVLANAILRHVLGTHPNAKTRAGPVNADHPDGVYPVAPKSIPITMGDVVYGFENLIARYAPKDGHPGVQIKHVTGDFCDVIGNVDPTSGKETFKMIALADLNPLPYKGVDLTNADVASVNSAGGQIAHVFDFDDPNALRIEGLNDSLKNLEMTVTLPENAMFLPGGDSKDPVRQGNSPIWDIPTWEFEWMTLEMGRVRTIGPGPDDTGVTTPRVPVHCDEYELGTGVTAFSACIDEDGWAELTTFTDIGNPPPPAYMWDILAEVAQVRLHDPASPGDDALPEGSATVELTLNDENVEIMVDNDKLQEQVRANFRDNPAALTAFTKLLNDNAEGDADFYYIRPTGADVDYLYFITADDIRFDPDGNPVRPYDAYAHPGFYADAGLTKKLSSTGKVGDDDTHEKVAITPGQVLYAEDDAGHVFMIAVGLTKPDRSTITLDITRVR